VTRASASHHIYNNNTTQCDSRAPHLLTQLLCRARPSLSPDAYQLYLFRGITIGARISPFHAGLYQPRAALAQDHGELKEDDGCAGFGACESAWRSIRNTCLQRNGFIPEAFRRAALCPGAMLRTGKEEDERW